MNNVQLYGRITADPEVRYTQSKKAVCSFTLAVNRQKRDEADFIRCQAWEKVAENIGKYVQKGDRLLVNGAITTGSYKDRDGKTVYTTNVTVRTAQFVEMKKQDGGFTPAQDELPDQFEQSELDDDRLPF